MMKKYSKWILILIGIVLVAVVCFFFFFQKQEPSRFSSDAEKLSTQTNIENTDISSSNQPQIQETEIAKFSTKIIDKDDDRDTNMKITANKLNHHIVKKDEEFSFNDIAGNPTPEEGYKKAHVFMDGKMVEGYGGGNCQVSTTLYGAVLKVNGLKVTERHGHEQEVGYIELGKDATVAYDDLDFKFKNHTGNDIKIYTEVTSEKVTIKLVKLSV